uniref:Fibulin 2 n=1 Tax=Gadus morhua TaxID=8049 RepID=A0A8C5AI38_GADMO
HVTPRSIAKLTPDGDLKQDPYPEETQRDGAARGGPCSQRCSVVGGRYSCSCFAGYSLMPDRLSCDDVDECVSGVHSCGVGERCVNTVGSHVCERQLSCSAGYQSRNGVCEDIDECMVRTHNCGAGLVCKNTDGSFVCGPKQKCLTGFKLDSHGNCIDINECSSLSETCSPGFKCINTVGSYTCQRQVIQCSQGYQSGPDGTRCIDVDECLMGTYRCGAGQICHNLPGSYRCDCGAGYQFDTVRKVCNDVNECWRYPGRLCSQTCDNTPGSYQCSCTAGFALAFDGKNCDDLNECDSNPCSQECANIYGSYQCYCRQGFYLKEDGHTCEDIDECSQSIGNMCAFECVNVPGSYQCACPTTGYTMAANRHTCRDIDECTTGAHNCSGEQSCYNIQGSYRCLSFTCPPNYKKASDTRCEKLGCPGNAPECLKLPLRITYYQLNFQTDILTPAQIFRISPSPAYTGDQVSVAVTRGNEEGYFSTRKLNGFTGAVYLQRQVREAKDFLVDVEMKLLRQGSMTSFVARIHVFITASTL